MDTGPFAVGKKGAQGAGPASPFAQGIAEVERRLRTLEGRFSNLERRSQVTEENMLSSDRKIRAEIKLMTGELSDVKGQLADFAEKIRALVRELQGFAKVEDVDVIRKYLNFIEPLDFVTQNEIERIVKQAVEEALSQSQQEQLSGHGSEKEQN